MRRRAEPRGCRVDGEAAHHECSCNYTSTENICGLSDTHVPTLRASGSRRSTAWSSYLCRRMGVANILGEYFECYFSGFTYTLGPGK